MSPELIIGIIAGYFLVLIGISYLTSRGADTNTFFNANKSSPWYLVAFGMVGTTLSGVTFISVPGAVGNIQFSYFQVILGHIVGYTVIATILMPVYYKYNLITIYGYLERRFGFWTYKSGSMCFLVSRIAGAAFRLYLAATVLQVGIFNAWDVPFWVTVIVTIGLIWIYTFKGGIKTIVWTDTLQTTFMISAVILSIALIIQSLGMSFGDFWQVANESKYAQIFFWDPKSEQYFFKQFFAGIFIAIVMTGLDQDMMQKNLTCRNLKDAQKNMFSFTGVLVIVNFIFLVLGALLFVYANQKGIAIPEETDKLYPILAFQHFSNTVGIFFLLGIISATYSSADSALTALTTSFCVDFLNFNDEQNNEVRKQSIKKYVHFGFSILLFIVIVIFNEVNSQNVITAVYKAAGYTYGPLLGLYAFGLFFKPLIKDRYVPFLCILSPLVIYILNRFSEAWFNGHEMGFEILIYNGLLTFIGLWLLKRKQ